MRREQADHARQWHAQRGYEGRRGYRAAAQRRHGCAKADVHDDIFQEIIARRIGRHEAHSGGEETQDFPDAEAVAAYGKRKNRRNDTSAATRPANSSSARGQRRS